MAKMIINNTCPFCGRIITQDEPHEYTINKEGKRKVKLFFHTSCFDMYCEKQDDDI